MCPRLLGNFQKHKFLGHTLNNYTPWDFENYTKMPFIWILFILGYKESSRMERIPLSVLKKTQNTHHRQLTGKAWLYSVYNYILYKSVWMTRRRQARHEQTVAFRGGSAAGCTLGNLTACPVQLSELRKLLNLSVSQIPHMQERVSNKLCNAVLTC